MNRDRRRSALEHPQPSGEIDCSPLIDVSFLLLIFFLVTSVVQKAETDLGLLLPAPNGMPVDRESLVLEIRAEAGGRVDLNGNLVGSELADHGLPRLVAELKRSKALAAASETSLAAMIDIADDASQQRFADLLNACAAAGVETILIKAQGS